MSSNAKIGEHQPKMEPGEVTYIIGWEWVASCSKVKIIGQGQFEGQGYHSRSRSSQGRIFGQGQSGRSIY